MAAITLDVGVKLSGHASLLTPQSKIMLEDLASFDDLLPVIHIVFTFKILRRGNINSNSFVSPELE